MLEPDNELLYMVCSQYGQQTLASGHEPDTNMQHGQSQMVILCKLLAKKIKKEFKLKFTSDNQQIRQDPDAGAIAAQFDPERPYHASDAQSNLSDTLLLVFSQGSEQMPGQPTYINVERVTKTYLVTAVSNGRSISIDELKQNGLDLRVDVARQPTHYTHFFRCSGPGNYSPSHVFSMFLYRCIGFPSSVGARIDRGLDNSHLRLRLRTGTVHNYHSGTSALTKRVANSEICKKATYTRTGLEAFIYHQPGNNFLPRCKSISVYYVSPYRAGDEPIIQDGRAVNAFEEVVLLSGNVLPLVFGLQQVWKLGCRGSLGRRAKQPPKNAYVPSSVHVVSPTQSMQYFQSAGQYPLWYFLYGSARVQKAELYMRKGMTYTSAIGGRTAAKNLPGFTIASTYRISVFAVPRCLRHQLPGCHSAQLIHSSARAESSIARVNICFFIGPRGLKRSAERLGQTSAVNFAEHYYLSYQELLKVFYP
ncbi:hypothetical protein BDZ91DRAFT_767038 [Kalaharituber pfeilii]|nr:hypothetical protein BDZ91DRAFT_767038 [Kalaharituber pfeilii]